MFIATRNIFHIFLVVFSAGVPAKTDAITHAPAKSAFGFGSSKTSTDASAFSTTVATPFSFKTPDSAPKVTFGMNFNKPIAAQPATIQPFSSNTSAVVTPAFGSPSNQKTTVQPQQKPQPPSTQGIFDKLNSTTTDKENSKPAFSISTTTIPTAKPTVSVASTSATVFGASQVIAPSSTNNLPGNQTNFTTKLTSSLPAISSAAPSPFSGAFNLAGTIPATKPTTGTVISTITATPPVKTAVQPVNVNLLTPPDTNVPKTKVSTISTKTTFTSEQLSPIVADNTDNLFQGLKVCKPTVTPTTASTTPPASGASIFGGSSFVPTSTPDSSTSIFSGASASSSPFGGSSSFGTQPSPVVSSTSPFGSFAVPATAGTSIFGGVAVVPTTSMTATSMVKPDQSIFASAAASSASVFGGTATSTSVFSSPVGPFGGVGGGGTSIFGGSNAAVTPAAQSSPFGGVATSPSSPFGSVPAAATSSSPFGGGIFAQAAASTANAFKQTAPAAVPAAGTSIFGGASAFGNNAAISSAPATSSIFGGASSTLAPSAFGGGGVFGGGSSSFGTSSIFGGATGFGAAPSTGSGSFMQGGSSILQTGFAAPAAPGTASAGVFGGPPAFGTPSFGGAATFGSTKGSFGAFGQATSPTGFNTQVTQKNSLFESLGATENAGMTFGNIAQNSNANAPNPSFTGG